LVIAFIATELTVEYPLIRLRVVAKRNVWMSATLISIYGFGVMTTAFVLPDYLTRVQGLRELQIGDVLNWIALPQFIFVPLAAILLRRIDARILVVGFALIAYSSWLTPTSRMTGRVMISFPRKSPGPLGSPSDHRLDCLRRGKHYARRGAHDRRCDPNWPTFRQ
jgi:hypothetical protein